MKVLISGISSPLGRYTARLLTQQGYDVRGFSRSLPSDLEGVELIACDLLSPDLDEVVKECDIIVHIAALSSPWGKKRDFFNINVEGTRNLLEAGKKAGAKRFIYISSPSIYFEYCDHFDIDETFRAKKPVNHYASSKIAAEELLLNAKGIETITLRPKALFGPGDQVLIPRMLSALKMKGIPRFREDEIQIDITYIENVADAIALSITAPSSCSGSSYNITNSETVLMHPTIETIVEKIGFTYQERKVDYGLAQKIATLTETFSLFSGKEPLFTNYSIGALAFSQTLSIEKAKNELGYNPKISIAEGINRYKEWWHEHHTV